MTTQSPSVWDDVVGQANAVERLSRAAVKPVHAYLFVGPSGSTSDQAARAFSALLVAGVDDPQHRDVDLVLRGEHPDVNEVRRTGASISADQASEIVRSASRSPVEGDRKVMILHEFHLLQPNGAARLLKTIEEPPQSTIFIILAEFIPNDLITIASRCARVDFRAIGDDQIIERLIAEGIDEASARTAAPAALGSLPRARLLANDTELAARRTAFANTPRRLDGTGAMVMTIVDELLGLIESAAAPLTQRHEAEAAELQERIKRYGERGSGKKQLTERHRRELRRHRTDELLAGLSVMAGQYRDALVDGTIQRPDDAVAAVEQITSAMGALALNVNEALLLQSLLWSLPII